LKKAPQKLFEKIWEHYNTAAKKPPARRRF